MKRLSVLLALICLVSLPAAGGAQEVLWLQNPDLVLNAGLPSHDVAPPNDDFDTFAADDFTNTEPWEITAIITAQHLVNNAYSCATGFNWAIFGDGGGHPDGDPSGRGFPPVWSLSLPAGDPAMVVDGSGALLGLTIPLAERAVLPPGTWWLAFWLDSDTVCGAHFWYVADSTNGDVTNLVNPSGFYGWGTDWFPATDLGPYHDLVFGLGGYRTVCPAVYNSVNGALTIPEVDVTGKKYTVNMIRTNDSGYVFELTLARKETSGCGTAIYNPVTETLRINRVGIEGLTKSFVVDLALQDRPWFYFEVTGSSKYIYPTP